MAHQIQSFAIHPGDDNTPVVTVKDSAGNIVDISSATEIVWTMARSIRGAAVLTKDKTGGGITFVTDGTDGQFAITLPAGDTSALYGLYFHVSVVTLTGPAVSTVMEGVVTVTGPGGLIVDTNSYASLEASDIYYSVRNSSTWMAADVLTKEYGLISATQYLDATYQWRGRKTSRAQVLGWPRYGACDDDEYAIDQTVTPPEVLEALYVLALESLSGALLPAVERSGRVIKERKKVSILEKETVWSNGAPAGRTFSLVDGILAGVTEGSRLSGSFKVTR